jgi:hypothetical protein
MEKMLQIQIDKATAQEGVESFKDIYSKATQEQETLSKTLREQQKIIKVCSPHQWTLLMPCDSGNSRTQSTAARALYRPQ